MTAGELCGLNEDTDYPHGFRVLPRGRVVWHQAEVDSSRPTWGKWVRIRRYGAPLRAGPWSIGSDVRERYVLWETPVEVLSAPQLDTVSRWLV